ncbi:MAG: hypothetical protein P1V97_17625 [Planctomycetota bacterium]|nr:hypothetical protein [Planctomycetota bacterium]
MKRWQMDLTAMTKQAAMLKQLSQTLTAPTALGFYRKRSLIKKRLGIPKPPDDMKGGWKQEMRANLSFREYLEANACLHSNDSPRYSGF